MTTSQVVPDDLLEILICPACKSKVELKPDASGVKCVSCRRVYPVDPAIGPAMVVEEATIEDDSQTNETV